LRLSLAIIAKLDLFAASTGADVGKEKFLPKHSLKYPVIFLALDGLIVPDNIAILLFGTSLNVFKIENNDPIIWYARWLSSFSIPLSWIKCASSITVKLRFCILLTSFGADS